MTACKKLKRGKNVTIEDLYQNKNYVPPKERNLETIFEEPTESKNGAPVLTSYRKFKRYLDFDPFTGKVNKPKKRRLKKVKGRLRSSSRSSKNIDINVILEAISDSSDDCEMDLTVAASLCENDAAKDIVNMLPVGNKTMDDGTVKNDNSTAEYSVNKILSKNTYVKANSAHIVKDNVRVLSIVDEAVKNDRESISNMSVKDKALNFNVLCKPCTVLLHRVKVATI